MSTRAKGRVWRWIPLGVWLGAGFGTEPTAAQDWSPDGSLLAFSATVGTMPQVFVVRADGSGLRQLTTDSIEWRAPTWASDGSVVVYRGHGWVPPLPPRQQLFAVVRLDVTGNRPPAVIVEGGYNSNPAASPDGDWIAFSSNRDNVGGPHDLYVVRSDGSGLRRLTRHPDWHDHSPAWSPDGRRLVFVSGRHGRDQLYLIDVDGTGEGRLTHELGMDVQPDWSPDGTRIAFSSRRDGDVESVEDMDLYVLTLDTGEVTRLTSAPGYDGDPFWSPAGDGIAFSSQRTSESGPGMYVIGADGTGLRIVLPDSALPEPPSVVVAAAQRHHPA